MDVDVDDGGCWSTPANQEKAKISIKDERMAFQTRARSGKREWIQDPTPDIGTGIGAGEADGDCVSSENDDGVGGAASSGTRKLETEVPRVLEFEGLRKPDGLNIERDIKETYTTEERLKGVQERLGTGGDSTGMRKGGSGDGAEGKHEACARGASHNEGGGTEEGDPEQYEGVAGVGEDGRRMEYTAGKLDWRWAQTAPGRGKQSGLLRTDGQTAAQVQLRVRGGGDAGGEMAEVGEDVRRTEHVAGDRYAAGELTRRWAQAALGGGRQPQQHRTGGQPAALRMRGWRWRGKQMRSEMGKTSTEGGFR